MLKRICKWAAPAFLLLFLLLALYGVARPWPVATEALSAYQGQTPILVGAGFKSTSSSTQTHRSYVLFPAVWGDLAIVTVRQIDHSPGQVQAEPYALVPLLIWLGLCAVSTWWFWFRKGGSNVT